MRLLIAAGLWIAASVAGGPAPAAAPDYARPESWACRPGAEVRCTADLDAVVVDAAGTRTPQPFVAAADPGNDCFYVYPTVSREEAPLADLQPSPEIITAIRAQAGRLASRCRLFVPLYRQTTLAGLRAAFAGGRAPDWSTPYADVLAAWRAYLRSDNHGRGVVLIGHSQGTILLQRLIAEEIDGRPAQKLLVSAFLAGDPGLAVPTGQTVGGTFRHVPLCARAAQTGCAYVWSSFAAGGAIAPRLFGTTDLPGAPAACNSPAAPGGGTAPLKAYLPRPAFAPASDPPWVEAVGQMSGTCAGDAHGTVLQVAPLPGRYRDLIAAVLSDGSGRPGWGLHRLDVSLVEGNMLDVIDAEQRTWRRR